MTNTDRLFNHEQGEELVRAVSEIAAAMVGDINVNAEISDIVNVYGAKNLLENTLSSGTSQSVTYTVNANKSISFSGTAAATFIICIGVINVKQGKSYTLSGGYSSNVHLDLRVAASGSSAIWNNNTESKAVVSPQESGALLTFTANADETVYVHFRVGNGTNTSGVVLYPMIRLASIEDDTYVPYAKTNPQLTQETTGLIDNDFANGAVNLLPNYASSQVINGLTFEVNPAGYPQGSIKVSGLSTAETTLRLDLSPIKAGNYKLSGCPKNGSNDTYSLKYYYRVNSWTAITDVGNGIPISLSVTVNENYVGINIKNNVNIDNPIIFKPMLTLASQPNSDYAHYVPYAKTNKELTDDKAEKIDLTSINITSGTTNNTGSTIASSTFFYYKGSLVRAKTDIANGATLTLNTNYEVVTAGGLNALNSDLLKINAPEFISHNIPRLIPKDISAYIADGSFWNRLNGTGGYSLFEDIFVGDYVKMSRAITAPNQDSQYATTGSQYITLIGLDTRMGDGDGGDSVSVINYHHSIWTAGQGFGGTQHFGRKRMNSSNTTTGGYVNSEMFTATIGSAVSSGSIASGATINQQLYAEFGSHLKKTRELLTKTINATAYNRFGTNSGASSDWAWATCQAVLMSEVEVYGSTVWSSSGYDTGNANKQFPLFAFSKEAMNNRSAYYWLKDVASGAYFCYCDHYGISSYLGASHANRDVRPRFILA